LEIFGNLLLTKGALLAIYSKDINNLRYKTIQA